MPAFNKIEKLLCLSGVVFGLMVGLGVNVSGAANITELPSIKKPMDTQLSATPVAVSPVKAAPLVRPLQQTWIF